ncbi:MAG: hypothetical protein WA747_09000 [Steroidobacteraceae bacterium]
MLRNNLLVMSAFVVVSACAVSRLDPLAIPLTYKPDPKNAGVLGGLSCNAISRLQVSDARVEKTLGIRTHESKPLKADVTAANDPAAWVRDGLQSFLAQNGASFQGNGPTLLVSLDSLHTVESVWHRAGYDARIALTAQLQSPAGKTCWKESVEGTGGNYGYAGSMQNYRETLNWALDAASMDLAESQGFKTALCHCAD